MSWYASHLGASSALSSKLTIPIQHDALFLLQYVGSIEYRAIKLGIAKPLNSDTVDKTLAELQRVVRAGVSINAKGMEWP